MVWKEGWADYLPLLVRNSPSIQHYGTTYDFEDRTYGASDTPFDKGPSVEGNVAAILWDLTDGTGEPSGGADRDDVSGLERAVWDVFDSPAQSAHTAPHEDFDEFVDQWRLDFPHRPINRILSLNTYTDWIPNPDAIFADALNHDLSRWSNTGDDDWTVSQYRVQRPPFTSESIYDVTAAEDCDDECVLELTRPRDLDGFGNVTLSFYYVDRDVDGAEGLRDGLTAYVDGHDRSDRRMSLSLNGTLANDAPLTLGATGAGTELSVDAAVDELRVYSRELTAREAFELYAAGTG